MKVKMMEVGVFISYSFGSFGVSPVYHITLHSAFAS